MNAAKQYGAVAPTKSSPVPEVSTYYGLFIEQDDFRPIMLSRYEDLTRSFGERAYAGLSVKWFVRRIVLESDKFRSAATSPTESSSG